MIDTIKHLKLKIEKGDSPDFIEIVSRIINSLADKFDIDEISIVKIKNWFDHKWLNYSGKGLIHFKGTLNPDKVALTNFWKDKITVPPFNPNRVLSEQIFIRHKTGNKNFENILHIDQRSTENQNNRITSKSDNGIFIWFSSNTITNQQGSLMVYKVIGQNVNSWYASIENKSGWSITKSKGINLTELKKIIE